jgi:hypothetical protein
MGAGGMSCLVERDRLEGERHTGDVRPDGRRAYVQPPFDRYAA